MKPPYNIPTNSTPEQQDKALRTVSNLGGFTSPGTQSTASPALPKTNQYGNDMTLTNRMNAGADQLKQMRTGGSTPAAPGGTQFQAPEAPKIDLFSRPGDSYGDSQMREQEYQSLLKQAATTKGITRNQRDAMVSAAQGLLAPGLQQAALQNQAYQQQAGTYNQAIQSGYLPGAPPTAAALPDPTKPAQPTVGEADDAQQQIPPGMMEFWKQFQAYQMQQTTPTTGLSAVPGQ